MERGSLSFVGGDWKGYICGGFVFGVCLLNSS